MSENPPDSCAVYFLVRDGQIVYVGSSEYPSHRVWQHTRCKAKQFDAAFYLPVDDPGQLEAVERYWIVTIRPMHNGAFNPSHDPAVPVWGQHLPKSKRRPFRSVRVTPRLAGVIEAACERECYSFKEFVREACVAHLRNKGYLPKPPD